MQRWPLELLEEDKEFDDAEEEEGGRPKRRRRSKSAFSKLVDTLNVRLSDHLISVSSIDEKYIYYFNIWDKVNINSMQDLKPRIGARPTALGASARSLGEGPFSSGGQVGGYGGGGRGEGFGNRAGAASSAAAGEVLTTGGMTGGKTIGKTATGGKTGWKTGGTTASRETRGGKTGWTAEESPVMTTSRARRKAVTGTVGAIGSEWSCTVLLLRRHLASGKNNQMGLWDKMNCLLFTQMN